VIKKRPVPRQAMALVMPSIEVLFGLAKRHHIHIVIMDPQLKPWEAKFEESIWHEESIGDEKKWEHDYKGIARSKAEQAWRNLQSSVPVQVMAPATLRVGDTPYYGSFNHLGVIVSCSGIEPYFDTLISGWIALAIQQLAYHHLKHHEDVHPGEDFIVSDEK
jgi:hypothetical protein